MADKVKIDGQVKTITIGRKEDKEGNAILVARVLVEFTPTEHGIAELKDLITMQDQLVNVTIAAMQIELPMAKW